MRITSKALDDVCIGHLIKKSQKVILRDGCFECKYDNYNKLCPNYKSVMMVIYEAEKDIND